MIDATALEVISPGSHLPRLAVAHDDVIVMAQSGASLDLDGIERALKWLEAQPSVDVVFGDSWRTDDPADGVLRRPGPAPERLRCQYFWGDVLLIRSRALTAAVGDLEDGVVPSLWELALRSTRENLRIHHVSIPISHARRVDARPDADEVRRFLSEHLAATGGGDLVAVDGDIAITTRPVRGEPSVSIVIPTQGRRAADGSSFVLDAVRGIVERTTYREYEVVLVVDRGADPRLLDEIGALLGDRIELVEWDRPFNFSGKVNLGAVVAGGEFLLLLNDDVQLITGGWIEAMLPLAQLDDAGAVGCMLYYDDDTVQHAGHHYWQGDAKHIAMFAPRDSSGPLDGLRVEREVGGVTAACALIARSRYFEVGGMTELLPGAFNDVDFCLKLLAAGYQNYWTPHAELYHFESKSRDPTVHRWEVDVAWSRWGSRMHMPQFWPYPD